MKPVDSAWFQRLKLRYEEPLSNFAFKLNVRRYTSEVTALIRRTLLW